MCSRRQSPPSFANWNSPSAVPFSYSRSAESVPVDPDSVEVERPPPVVFAILGGVTGVLTYVFSGGDTDAAMAVWGTSVYGTYVITPDHLKGDKAVRFLGVPPGKDGGEASSAK